MIKTKHKIMREFSEIYLILSAGRYEKRSIPIGAAVAMTIGMINPLLDKSDAEILDHMRIKYPQIHISDVIRMRQLFKEYNDTDDSNNDKELVEIESFLDELGSRKTKVSTR